MIESRKTSVKQSIEMLLKGEKNNSFISKESTQFENFLPIEDLVPNANQPRHYFNEDELNELVESIKQDGILQPLLVRKNDNEKYEIIAGERRWRAASKAGLRKVPVIIKTVSDDTSLALALVENIQRSQLNVVEEAKAFAKLADEFNMTHDMLATRVGRSRSSITNVISILTLPQIVQEALQVGKIHFGHAKLLFSCSTEMAELICAEVVKKSLSVRQTENFMKKLFISKSMQDNKRNNKELDFKKFIPALTKLFGSRVDIKTLKDGKQKIVCVFDSAQALQTYLDKVLG